MQALSDAQYRAATQGGVPAPERVYTSANGAELWSVPVPMPGELLAYTLSAILLDTTGAVTIVDPGWATPETHEHLHAALASLGRSASDIENIVVTHAHPDHLGAAGELRQLSGARLMIHEREQLAVDRAKAADASGGVDAGALAAGWGAPVEVQDRLTDWAAKNRGEGNRDLPGPADLLLRDGDVLPIRGVGWSVLFTPGHTAGHICIVDRENRLLFSGDHVLPTLFPGIGLGVDWEQEAGRSGGERAESTESPEPDEAAELVEGAETNPVADYLASLERLAPYDDFDVLPGHGYRFTGLAGRRAQASNHILSRAREVAAAIAAAPSASVWQIASRLNWSAGWERLSTSSMLPSALLQTGLYLDFARDDSARDGRVGADNT